ncbi:hypothetical protein ACYOEI_42125, partial [Singulisphaera rosea]
DRPIEDGYFRGIRAVVTGSEPQATDDGRLGWIPSDSAPGGLTTRLARFMRGELERIGGDSSDCENYIRNCYTAVPEEQLAHPAFALVQYPLFDMGSISIEFAGSILSPTELRLWSRPAYFHK